MPAHAACSNTVFGSTTCIQSDAPAAISCTSGAGQTSTMAANVTAGHQLIVAVFDRAAGPGTFTISSSPANTFVDSGLGEINGPTNGGAAQMWIVTNAAGGSTAITVKPQFTSSCNVVTSEWTGINTSTPVRDKISANAASGTAWDSGSIAAALSNDLCIGFGTSGLSTDPTVGAGYTKLEGTAGSITMFEAKVCAGADHALATGSNNPWVMGGVAFQPAVVVPPATTVLPKTTIFNTTEF